MFFKTSSYFIWPLLIFITLTISCGGEGRAPAVSFDVDLKSNGGRCLSDVGAQIQKYLHSELSEEGVLDLWTCLDGALDDFVTITAPEHPQGYPPEALAHFFERFFVKREVPTPVAEALMNLKRVLVGGDRRFLTQEEIVRLKFVIEKAKNWSLRLRSHVSVLSLKNADQIQFSQLEASFSELKAVAAEIGFWLESQNQVYSQKEIQELLQSLSAWLESSLTAQVFDKVSETLPVFFDLKTIVIGGSSHSMRPEEWPLFLTKTTSVLSLFQMVSLKWKQEDLSALATDQTYRGLFEEFRSLFVGVRVPFSEFESVIKKASRLSWWPKEMKPEAISEALAFFLQKFIGINQSREELFIDHRLIESINRLLKFYSDCLKGVEPRFHQFLNQLDGIDTDSKGLIVFSFQKTENEHSKRQHQLALIYSAVHQLSQSYRSSHFDRHLFVKVFGEVLDVLHGLKILNSVEEDYAFRLFREVNVFTLISDGDAVVSPEELSVYGWMALSGYAYQNWVTSLQEPNCRMVESCVFEQWQLGFSQYFDSFPHLKSYLFDLSEQERFHFFDIAKGASGSEMLTMNAVILSYLEFYLMHFDDGDGFLVEEEVFDSYAVFGPTLQELLEGVGLPPGDTLAFFTYLFKFGSTPLDQSDLGAYLRYVNWKLHPEKWKLRADRMRLLQILFELSKL